MKVRRRDALKLGAAASAGAALSGCSVVVKRLTKPPVPDVVALPAGDVAPEVRLLNRVTFGPRPGDVDRVARIGREKYLDAQLNPNDEDESIVGLRLGGLEVLQIDAAELRDLPPHEALRQLQQAAIIRAVYSRHQLRERMVDFWTNHFNIYARKGDGAYFIPTDDLNVVRKHAIGTFPELLRASAHSPAMLMYLDNQVNRRKDAKGAGANENYARELMELHTLGVHGGYTQKDVQEVARCLTGWTVEDRFLHAKGRFRFDPERHDNGRKVVLGHVIPPGGGQKDGEMVLDILAKHPSTAHFIAHKLCREFLGDAADRWSDRLAATYLDTSGDLKAMLRPLLLSQDLLDGPPILKRPFDFTVSALRVLNADTDGNKPVQEHLARMGQPLYQWPMPDGYPDKAAAWTGSLLARWNFAAAVMAGGVPGTAADVAALLRAADATTDPQSADALLGLVLGHKPDTAAAKAMRGRLVAHAARVRASGDRKRQPAAECAALLLASPDFQWR